MDKYTNIDAHSAARKRQYVKKKNRAKAIVISLLVITILAIWAILIYCTYLLYQSNKADDIVTTPFDAIITEPVGSQTQPPIVTTAPREINQTIDIDNQDFATGNLILVSSKLGRQFTFPEDNSHIITLYGNKSTSYRVSSTSLSLRDNVVDALNEMFDAYYDETGNFDYQITQGYRTLEDQESIYTSYLETYGIEEGAKLAAVPGFSEHHSGLAFDMNVYTTDGISYSIGSASEVDPSYGWIYENADKYGFVLRYPEGKTDITGINNEPWHFRYVGRGHASYMLENDLTLEEYIDLLDGYKQSAPLCFEYDDVSYEVFYKRIASGDTTSITLPVDTQYSISGNNCDGFIITITK